MSLFAWAWEQAIRRAAFAPKGKRRERQAQLRAHVRAMLEAGR